MRPDDLRRWIDGRVAAEQRERAEARVAGPAPVSAISQALGLIALAGRLHGWPLPVDAVSRREAEAVHAQWIRLRSALLDRPRPGERASGTHGAGC